MCRRRSMFHGTDSPKKYCVLHVNEFKQTKLKTYHKKSIKILFKVSSVLPAVFKIQNYNEVRNSKLQRSSKSFCFHKKYNKFDYSSLFWTKKVQSNVPKCKTFQPEVKIVPVKNSKLTNLLQKPTNFHSFVLVSHNHVQ